MYELDKLTLPTLKKLAKQHKVLGYSQLRKSDLIAKLSNITLEALPEDIELDSDQAKTLELMNNKLVLINSGPGSGKTTTLTHCIKSLETNLRVIVISYNTEVEKRIKTFLQNMGVKLLPKNAHFDKVGVRISTFHQLCYSIIHTTTGRKPYFEEFSDLLNKTLLHLDSTRSFDYLFIDEAHDISDELIILTEALIEHSNHVILAGDPRQEINSDSSWFSKMLIKYPKQIHSLRFNHRSNTRIVKLLNDYSNKMFPEYPPQIAMSTKKGRIRVKSLGCNPSETLFNEILKYPKALIVAPISSTKYGLTQLFNEVNEMLLTSGSFLKIKILEDKLIDDNTMIFAASSLKIKGLEAKSVIVLRGETEIPFSEELFKKRLYVALSRAQRNLIILYGSVRNSIFSELPGVEITSTPTIVKTVSKIGRSYEATECIPILAQLIKPKITPDVCAAVDWGAVTTHKREVFKNFDLAQIPEGYHPFLPKFREVVFSEVGTCLRAETCINVMSTKINVKETIIRMTGPINNQVVVLMTYATEAQINDDLMLLSTHMLLSLTDGKLYNFHTGKLYKVSLHKVMIPHFWSLPCLSQAMRAYYFINYAKKLTNHKRIALKQDIIGKILVTFDLETFNGYPKEGCTLMEIGGLACYSSGQLVSMIYDKGKNTTECDLSVVGIIYDGIDENDMMDNAKEGSDELYSACKEWYQTFQSHEISLKWAANESDYIIVGAQPALEIDVMEIYSEWRLENQIIRTHADGYRSLSDCVMDIFKGVIPFRAHNAYEDAFMTLLCFLAMIELG